MANLKTSHPARFCMNWASVENTVCDNSRLSCAPLFHPDGEDTIRHPKFSSSAGPVGID